MTIRAAGTCLRVLRRCSYNTAAGAVDAAECAERPVTAACIAVWMLLPLLPVAEDVPRGNTISQPSFVRRAGAP